MKHLLTILLVVLLTIPAWADLEPTITLPYSYNDKFYGPLNGKVVQGFTGSAMLYSQFRDLDGGGYGFAIAGVSGKIYPPFADFAFGSYTAYSTCWYEGGWKSGPMSIPRGENGSHYCIATAWAKEKKDFGQWWKQTSPQWASVPYGRNGWSTTRAYGCCALCATMQLNFWGWDIDPARLIGQLVAAKDGFVGKRGLSVNWERLCKIYHCGFRRGVAIKEALLRGMTVQAGVRHDSGGSAGHWTLPYLLANIGYIIYDPMGRGEIDKEIPEYGDGRDDGCWENDTRLLYPMTFSAILEKGSSSSQSSLNAMPTRSLGVAGPVRIDEDFVKQNLGKIAMSRLADMYLGTNKDESKVAAFQSTSASTESIFSGRAALDKDALVHWGYSAYVAWANVGDVRLALKLDNAVIARDEAESLENAETGEMITDYVLDAHAIQGGDYVLEITGAPGTQFEVQTYEYGSTLSDPDIDKLITGTIGADGIYRHAFTHMARAFLVDIAGLEFIPVGTNFTMSGYADITAKLASGEYAVQSQIPLVFPWKMTYTGTDPIQEFTYYRIQGTLGANRTINVDAMIPVSSEPGSVRCPSVFRNTKQIFDPAAGCLYTKTAGIVKEIGNDYVMVDGVKVKIAPPAWLQNGQTVSVCGVPVAGEFVGNVSTLSLYEDYSW